MVHVAFEEGFVADSAVLSVELDDAKAGVVKTAGETVAGKACIDSAVDTDRSHISEAGAGSGASEEMDTAVVLR